MTDQSPVVPPPPPPPDINDLPTDPVAAKSMRDKLIAHPEFMKDWNTDKAKWTALGYLKWVADGRPPDQYGDRPYTPDADPDGQNDARVAAAIAQHAQFYAARGYTEQQQREIVGQRFITAAERAWHEMQWREKSNSPAFMARWNAREPDAIREMANHAIAMKLPLGTLDDIKRWENA